MTIPIRIDNIYALDEILKRKKQIKPNRAQHISTTMHTHATTHTDIHQKREKRPYIQRKEKYTHTEIETDGESAYATNKYA